MRKESRQAVTMNYQTIQGYHNRTWDESYASTGFDCGFRYWASDRPIDADKVENPKGYGIEWETVSGINNQRVMVFALSTIANEIFTRGIVKFQNDSSLGGESNAEMITEIMTKAYIRNNYNAWKEFYNVTKAMDICPDESCGQHVNISIANFGKTKEKQIESMVKIHNWMSKNYELACKLLKRNETHTMYCRRMEEITPDDVKNDNVITGHGVCINWAHVNEDTKTARLEIRLVGPQKTFVMFRNTLEVIFWLVKQSKELPAKDWDNPEKLWSGCNQYVMQRLSGFLDADTERKIAAAVVREELI